MKISKRVKLGILCCAVAFSTVDAHAITVTWTGAASSKPESKPIRRVTAKLSAVSAVSVVVPFTLSGTATYGSDYQVSTAPITIPPGSISATLNVGITNDGLMEQDETIIVTMGTPVNATTGPVTVRTLTVVNDD